MTSAAITDVSNKQLAALTAGGWVDDCNDMPGWERQVMVAEDGRQRRMRQWMFMIFPHYLRPGEWIAGSGDEETLAASLDEALEWCSDRAGNSKICVSEGTATNQADRFSQISDNG